MDKTGTALVAKLAQHDKPARKFQVAAPTAKAGKSQVTGDPVEKRDEAKEPVAKAA